MCKLVSKTARPIQRRSGRYECPDRKTNRQIDRWLLVQFVDGERALEIAYSLLGTYRNRGYATEAVIKCRDHAFENNYSDSLISIVSLLNLASARVAMKAVKQTIYNRNRVNIFRVDKMDWLIREHQ